MKTELELDRVKFLVIFVMFLFLGLTSVVMQLFLPEILEFSGIEVLNLPDPSIESILLDYWGDITIQSMIIILVCMSSFSSELDINKTGYIYLARPISRGNYFLTRFILRVGMVILAFILGSFLSILYACLFFPAIDWGAFLLSAILLSLNLGSIASISISLSTKYQSSISGGIAFLVMIVQLMIGSINKLKSFSPFALSGIWKEIIFQKSNTFDIWINLFSLMIWILLPGIFGFIQYRRRDLI